MTAELIYLHIEKPEGDVVRLQRMPRVRVAQIVMDDLACGWSAEEMGRLARASGRIQKGRRREARHE